MLFSVSYAYILPHQKSLLGQSCHPGTYHIAGDALLSTIIEFVNNLCKAPTPGPPDLHFVEVHLDHKKIAIHDFPHLAHWRGDLPMTSQSMD
jgi:hypothetical protein